MEKQVRYLIAVLLITLLGACDSARFPIDSTPSVKIDPRLLGTWKVKGKHEEFTLIRHTDNQYMLLYRNRRHDDIEKYIAFLSYIDNTPFLNICAQGDSTSEYIFIKIIDINPIKNVVTAAGVADSTLQYLTDAAAVRERITQNLNNPAFYGDTSYFFRISK